MRPTSSLTVGLALSAAVLSADVAFAANRAIVIGIDEYDFVGDLGGAVNDAKLISSALKQFGVTSLEVFLNDEATYDTISTAWTKALDASEPGDTIILTYAGHGGQERDLDGDEASVDQPNDRTDETLILPAFNPQSETGSAEKIVDDELHTWFLAARDRNVQVVFVADSCYSGTVTRGGRARFLPELAGLVEDIDREPRPTVAQTEEETIENVVFLAGAREAEVVVEVEIDGRYHGALSYSFAKALEMLGDLDQDGVLGRDDLAEFLPRTAKSFNGSRYLPELLPSTGPDFPVLIPDLEFAGAGDVDLGPGGGEVKPPQDPNKLPIQSAPGTYWDRQTGNIVDPLGDVLGFAVPENRLAEVNDKFKLLGLAREGLLRNGMSLGVEIQGTPWHREIQGTTQFDIVIESVPAPYLTIFNLANNGEVQLVYPYEPSERAPLRPGQRVVLPSASGAPWGADDLIAVATTFEPTELWQNLNWAQPASVFVSGLTRLVANGDAHFGHFSLVTKE